jgi:Spy/CpxP family protein refolding chaperone
MRRLIILSSSVAVAALLGITVLDAQRPRGGDPAGRQAAVDQRGDRQGPASMRGGRGDRGRMAGPAGQAGRRGGPAFGPGLRLGPGLELTDEQREAVQAAERSARDASAPVADELQVARRALHRAVFADTRDDAAVGELAAKVAALENQLAALHLTSQVALADLLTDEQKQAVRTRTGRGPGGAARGPGRGR